MSFYQIWNIYQLRDRILLLLLYEDIQNICSITGYKIADKLKDRYLNYPYIHDKLALEMHEIYNAKRYNLDGWYVFDKLLNTITNIIYNLQSIPENTSICFWHIIKNKNTRMGIDISYSKARSIIKVYISLSQNIMKRKGNGMTSFELSVFYSFQGKEQKHWKEDTLDATFDLCSFFNSGRYSTLSSYSTVSKWQCTRRYLTQY